MSVSVVSAIGGRNREPAVLVHHGIVCRWFVSYAMSLSFFLSIVIVYNITLLLSMMYQFQSRSGKKLTAWIYG